MTKSTSTSKSTFPLLSLPPEVRLYIYHYLIPNLPIRNFPLIRTSSRTPPLRTDNKSCSPSLLRTNRRIYTEAVREWYANTTYEVVLDSKYILFCGKVIPPYVPLPSTIRLVQSMCLCISIQRMPQNIQGLGTVEHLMGFQDRLDELARCLRDPVGRELRYLRIQVAVDIPLLLSLSKTPGELVELLRWNLDPVREKVQGLKEVSWEVNEQSYGIQSEEFLRSYKELREIMYAFLEGMRSEMMEGLEEG